MRIICIVMCSMIFTFLTSPIILSAGQICEEMTLKDADKVDTHLLALVDKILSKWPQHQKLKNMMSKNEEIEYYWKDVKQQIIVECAREDEFKAGYVLGHQVAMYKSMLTEMKNDPNSVTK